MRTAEAISAPVQTELFNGSRVQESVVITVGKHTFGTFSTDEGLIIVLDTNGIVAFPIVLSGEHVFSSEDTPTNHSGGSRKRAGVQGQNRF